MRNFNKLHTLIVVELFLFAAFSVLIGCQTTFNRYLGKVVPEANRISLPESKPQSIVWQTKDVVFQYTGKQESGKLSLTGELTLDKSYERFNSIEYLYFWIHFLDSEGTILDSKLILSVVGQFAYSGGEKKWPVNIDLKLPSHFIAMTFSYMGSVREGQGGGDQWNFYRSPLS